MVGLILAAAGSSSRFAGKVPKQFTLMEGRPLYLRALEPFVPLVDEAVVVVPHSRRVDVKRQIDSLEFHEKVCLETGGPHRQDSVRRGLRCLSTKVELVLVHDAARPFVSTSLIESVIETTRQKGSCIPVLPVPDTIKEVRGDVVVRTLQRSCLRRVQTPQGFPIDLLRQAFERAEQDGFLGTDEAALVERLSHPVHVTLGDPANIKVTWKEDLD